VRLLVVRAPSSPSGALNESRRLSDHPRVLASARAGPSARALVDAPPVATSPTSTVSAIAIADAGACSPDASLSSSSSYCDECPRCRTHRAGEVRLARAPAVLAGASDTGTGSAFASIFHGLAADARRPPGKRPPMARIRHRHFHHSAHAPRADASHTAVIQVPHARGRISPQRRRHRETVPIGLSGSTCAGAADIARGGRSAGVVAPAVARPADAGIVLTGMVPAYPYAVHGLRPHIPPAPPAPTREVHLPPAPVAAAAPPPAMSRGALAAATAAPITLPLAGVAVPGAPAPSVPGFPRGLGSDFLTGLAERYGVPRNASTDADTVPHHRSPRPASVSIAADDLPFGAGDADWIDPARNVPPTPPRRDRRALFAPPATALPSPASALPAPAVPPPAAPPPVAPSSVAAAASAALAVSLSTQLLHEVVAAHVREALSEQRQPRAPPSTFDNTSLSPPPGAGPPLWPALMAPHAPPGSTLADSSETAFPGAPPPQTPPAWLPPVERPTPQTQASPGTVTATGRPTFTPASGPRAGASALVLGPRRGSGVIPAYMRLAMMQARRGLVPALEWHPPPSPTHTYLSSFDRASCVDVLMHVVFSVRARGR